MTPLFLIIMASLIAAVAFFAAGFLLSPPQPPPPMVAEPGEENERTEDLRELIAVKALEKELEELRASHAVLVRERDQARAEQARLRSEERQVAERLRVAEDANRAAFEREENAAEGWATQLAAAQADQKRRERELERRLDEAKGELAHARAERERVLGEAARAAADGLAARAALDELHEQTAREQARRGEEQAAERARLATAIADATTDVESKLATALETAQATAQAREQSLATTIAELERALAQERAQRDDLASQLAQQHAQRKAVEDAREEMELRMRAAEEVVELLRSQVANLNEAVRVAELRAKDRERLGEENTELRARLTDAQRDAADHADRADETRDAKVQLAAAQAKLVELARVLDENRRLRDEVAELRTHERASDELERERAAHKQVRLDAELMARRLQDLVRERTELESLRARAADADALASEVEYLRGREKDLEAQIYANGSYSSREMRALSGEIPMVTPISDLETNLALLVGHGSARTAVLADGQGFLIASAGESVAEEGLAAFAAVASEMVGRARMLLPLADIRSIRVLDANDMVLTCHLFDSSGEPMGVATLGPAEAPADNTARAIAGVAAVVAPRDAGDETPEPEA